LGGPFAGLEILQDRKVSYLCQDSNIKLSSV
jgi:hypothetical protein